MKSIISLLMLMVALTLSAQDTNADSTKNAPRGMLMYTDVRDHVTHDPIKDVRAELLWAADSSFVDTTHFEYNDEEYYKNSSLSFMIKKPGNYLVRMEADGYQTRYLPVEVKRLYKRENYRYLKTTYLRTIPKKNEMFLDDVVVVATKLKFYMNGDTLVYDADAFNMAEGSMLGALIRKLPGVELEKGGVIKVNGRQVDALLLNGKNFFDSDRELLLENMPSYMVKNIQSYERVPEEVKGTPRENAVKKELVMNVKLKREYATGWIANAEGGIGSTFFRNQNDKLDTKWMGRLFGLRFTENSRLNVYANMNNLNDQGGAGYEGEWGQLSQSEGLTTSYNGGINYTTDKENKYRYMGNLNASYADTDNHSNTSNATFLEGGNTYGRSFQNSRNYRWEFNTHQQLVLEHGEPLWDTFRHIYLTFNPHFRYNKSDNRGNNGSTTLSEDVASQLGKEWMDSIMAPDASSLLRQYAINRSTTTSKGLTHSNDAGITGFLSFMPAHNDFINFNINYTYNFSKNDVDNYEHYRLDYPNGNHNLNDNLNQETDFRNRYNPGRSRHHDGNIAFNTGFALDKNQHNRIDFTYSFNHSYDKEENTLYLLNKLNGWQDSESQPLGALPSVTEMLTTLDAENSARSTMRNDRHDTQLNYTLTFYKESTYSMFNFGLQMPVTHESLDYLRGTQVDTLMSRNTFFVHPHFNFNHENNKKGFGYNFDCSITTSAPSMTSLLNIRDDSNPLYITLGNPNLKNTHAYSISAGSHYRLGKTWLNFNLNTNITENAIASGYIYNKETGVRTVTPDNVNGNWSFGANIGANIALDKDDKWRLNHRITYQHNNSVDLSGTNQSLVATKSVVKNNSINDGIILTWRPNSKYEFGTSGNLNYQHSTSNRDNFTQMNTYTFNYGVRTQIELPLDMQLSTDLTMYSRRGYSEASMNTNELVWNARMSKRLMKGKLTIMFDGFDLLGNLSNVRRYVNAQGRTETFYNVIPSYGILHAIYRLNKQPKKKSE
ncbi:MAG: outer membrane beta-barrel protein [Bacteroidaceae bacterium]|nr:outer membrane beta-barrel protein [Bacteroidaceae bacterium]